MANTTPGNPVLIDGYTAPATVTPTRQYIKNRLGQTTFATSVQFNNQDATSSLKVYINDSPAYLTLKPGASQTFNGNVSSFTVASSAGTCAWTAVAQAV